MLDETAKSNNLFDMQTNVSGLLRNFPRVKMAALRGERVIIRTREGNLVLQAEKPSGHSLFGCLAGKLQEKGLHAETSGLREGDWKPGL